MRAVTSREMLKIEEQAEALFGLSTGLLMERAGQAVAEAAEKMLLDRGNVFIVCGKGNNGGDGFVAARLLSGSGYKVTAFSLAERDTFPTAARDAFDKLPPGVKLITDLDFYLLDQAIIESDLIIDAIFGFSLKGAVRGIAADVIDRINVSQKLILSVDIPSGVEADTGKVYDRGVKADVTVTFTAPKVGMLLYPGSQYTGEFIVADIGIPDKLIEEYASSRYLERVDAYELLPARKIDVHKKSVGQILVIAGSRGMPGAAVLTGRAAYKMGAGLVMFAPPQNIMPVLNGALVEAIVRPQAETKAGTLSLDAYKSLIELASEYDVVAIGPGLTTNNQTVELVRKLIIAIEKPLVIDADGLNAIVGETEVLRKRRGKTVITPHPGEMARLFSVATGDILDDPLGFAIRAREEFGVTTVLKGPRTIISGPGESTINMTGNPGLATAGTGDVLTGFIAALVAQGLDVYNASSVAVYLHGLSADIAAEDISEYCLVASDVIDFLPEAITWVLG
ncbi:MAG: NAD(P)H-hydrate dehydratase [Actinobacteria bacterium]|nr:NAD(P)H-hydrate dehydratase [Actinomycetota bacterium]